MADHECNCNGQGCESGQGCSCDGGQGCAGTPDPPHKNDAKSPEKPDLRSDKLRERLGHITHKVLVLSGKGGVGKSTVAANLALALALEGRQVGLLDVDIHGPSIPKLLGLEGSPVTHEAGDIVPVELGTLKVMSIGFLLRSPDDAVIWRGPMKMGVIQQFLEQVIWGDLDWLVIDCPPGTGDEPLSVAQLIPDADGAVIVTTGQELSIVDVRKCVNFCRQVKMPVLGVIENMSGFVCPHCGKMSEIFPTGGGERMAAQMGVRFLGSVPIDPRLALAGDAGEPFLHRYADSPAAVAMRGAIDRLLE